MTDKKTKTKMKKIKGWINIHKNDHLNFEQVWQIQKQIYKYKKRALINKSFYEICVPIEIEYPVEEK